MLKIHPVCKVFPEMPADEYEKLRDDIRERGLIEPITVFEGYIVDGRHRYKACMEVGIHPESVTLSDYGGDLIGWVVSKNLHRRHLTASQRANIGKDLVPMYEAQANARMKAGTLPPQGGRVTSAKMAAKAVGSSERSVERAQNVAKEAPEKIAAIAAGTLTVKAAEREIKAEKAATPADPSGPLDDRTVQGLMASVRRIKAEITAVCETPIGKFIPLSSVITHLDATWNCVRAGKPYSKCPGCRDGCKACKKLGWVPKHVFDGFPEEMRKAVKAE